MNKQNKSYYRLYLNLKGNKKILTQEEADAIVVRNYNAGGLIIKDGVNFRKMIPVDKKVLEKILDYKYNIKCSFFWCFIFLQVR